MTLSEDVYPRFLFINPPYERLKGFSVQNPPLGLLYVATALTDAGYPARVYDADTSFSESLVCYNNATRAHRHAQYLENLENLEHPIWGELREVLLRNLPDVVGITAMTPTLHSAEVTASIVRAVLPNATLLVGGPHTTICGVGILQQSQFEFAFVGEGEKSIVQFAERFRQRTGYEGVPGLAYCGDGEVIEQGRAERISDLDALPFPNRDLLLFRESYQVSAFGAMIASRGCPYRCQFCASVPLWGRTVKLRTPEDVLAEIDYLVRHYGINTFGFWDDTFTANRSAVRVFCEELVRRYGSGRFRWSILTSVNVLDSELVRVLKDAGCDRIRIGVESGSERILERIEKGITKEKVRQAARIIQAQGISLHAYFMVGIPYETENDIRQTIAFMKELAPDSINLCTFTPYPGTKLYEYVCEKGMLDLDPRYRQYDGIGHHSDQGFFAPEMTQERYLMLLDEALRVSLQITNRLSFRKLCERIRRLSWHAFYRRLRALREWCGMKTD